MKQMWGRWQLGGYSVKSKGAWCYGYRWCGGMGLNWLTGLPLRQRKDVRRQGRENFGCRDGLREECARLGERIFQTTLAGMDRVKRRPGAQ